MQDPKVNILSIDEYQYAVKRGYEPLLDRLFILPIHLRIEIQNELFEKYKARIPKANQKFYKYVWNNKDHYCEECGSELLGYSAKFVSHILTKGAHPEKAHDPRNCNLLCFAHHQIWETGNRKTMRIYKPNIAVIDQLNSEYNQLHIR